MCASTPAASLATKSSRACSTTALSSSAVPGGAGVATRGAVVVPAADVDNIRTSSAPGRMLTRRPSKLTIRVYAGSRSEEHTSELQSLRHLVCRLLLEKKNTKT